MLERALRVLCQMLCPAFGVVELWLYGHTQTRPDDARGLLRSGSVSAELPVLCDGYWRAYPRLLNHVARCAQVGLAEGAALPKMHPR